MPEARFVQIHALHGYSGVLLNRDDSGLSKRLPVGDAERTRISSQCLKRHWREDTGQYSLQNIAPDAVRTKEMSTSIITSVLEGMTAPDIAEEIVRAFHMGLYGEDAPKTRQPRPGEEPEEESNRGTQPLLFGEPEIQFLCHRAQAIAEKAKTKDEAEKLSKKLFNKSEKNNFATFRQSAVMPAGLTGAMFGRMVTSDPDANITAAVHVAHAYTVHEQQTELDYFTAVEDLNQAHHRARLGVNGEDRRPGAGFIGETELTSGIFYVYVCIDLPTLKYNVRAEEDILAKATANMAGLIATVSPGAKKGSTAPYGYARELLAEIGERTPRTLDLAFEKAIEPDTETAIGKMKDTLEWFDGKYGTHEARRSLSSGSTLEEITEWIKAAVTRGETE